MKLKILIDHMYICYMLLLILLFKVSFAKTLYLFQLFLQFTALSSSQQEPQKYYKCDSGALKFQVKSRLGVAILTLISKNKPHRDLFQINLGRTCRIIDHMNRQDEIADTPQVVLTYFQEFWLQLFENQISLGLANNSRALFSLSAGEEKGLVGYIKFETRSNNAPSSAPVEWIIEVPPPLRMTNRIVRGGEPVWRYLRSGEPLPPDAFVGGMERGEPTYIARAPHQGSITPGKYLRSKNAAFIGWSYVEHRKEEFEILCGYNMMWVPGVHGGPPPVGALVTGVSQNENRDQLFSVRVRYHDDLVLGKHHDCHDDCNIPYDGQELQILTDFEILIVPSELPDRINHWH